MFEEEFQHELFLMRAMSHIDLARMWRFAPAGHPWFVINSRLFNAFEQRFYHELGGMTPEISKELGWEKTP